jgi:hypothetical protein
MKHILTNADIVKKRIKEAFKNISIPKYYPNYYGNVNTGNEILIQL